MDDHQLPCVRMHAGLGLEAIADTHGLAHHGCSKALAAS